MTAATKAFLLILGGLSAIFIVAQLAMGIAITKGAQLQTAHKHSGYTTVVVSLVYIAVSAWVILGTPAQNKTAK